MHITESPTPFLEFVDVSARYPKGRDLALSHLSFQLRAPVTFVVGENGSGKTTTFRVALGALRPSSGEVKLSPGRSGSLIGYCPQEFRLPHHVNVHEYLAYLAWLKGLDRKAVASDVDGAISLVGLADRSEDKIGILSGGMRRRVGLAQAILGDPSLVLLDEPTAGLDPVNRVLIRESLALMSERCHLVISTHLVDDMGMLGSDSDLLVLSRGELMFFGRESELDAPGPEIERASRRESSLIHAMRGFRS